MIRLLPIVLITLLHGTAQADEIQRIWLTHKSHDPSKLVVNWMTDEPGDSVVYFGRTRDYGETVRIDESVTLHHVEIPLEHSDTVYHYSVTSGNDRSADATFNAYPD